MSYKVDNPVLLKAFSKYFPDFRYAIAYDTRYVLYRKLKGTRGNACETTFISIEAANQLLK